MISNVKRWINGAYHAFWQSFVIAPIGGGLLLGICCTALLRCRQNTTNASAVAEDVG